MIANVDLAEALGRASDLLVSESPVTCDEGGVATGRGDVEACRGS